MDLLNHNRINTQNIPKNLTGMSHKRARISSKSDDSASKAKSEALPNPPTNIEAISDKELLSILCLLPLVDILSAELVNHRWRAISLSALRKRTSLSLRQGTLSREQRTDVTRHWFFKGHTSLHRFEDDCFNVTRKINYPALEWLIDRFHNITELSLYFVDYMQINEFVVAMKILFPKLQHLNMFNSQAQIDMYAPDFYSYKIGHNLFALESFRTNITFRSNVSSDDCSDRLDQALHHCPKTKFMAFTGSPRMYGLGYWHFGVMPKQSENLKTTANQIGFYTPPMPDDICENDKIIKRLSKKCSYKLKDKIEELEDKITHFDLGISHRTELYPFLSNLVKLTHLTHLRLVADCRANNTKNIFSPSLTPKNYCTKLTDRTLPSVHTLHLSEFPIGQSSRMFLYLPVIFPGVRVLHFEGCPVQNDWNRNAKKEKKKTKNKPFWKWFWRSLLRFPQLTHVYLDHQLKIVFADQCRVKRRQRIKIMEESIKAQLLEEPMNVQL